jgi:hypothetical protein
VSRRSRRREDAAGREPGGQTGREPGGPISSLGAQLVLLAGVFVLAVLVAELFGAANLGVAFGVGQIAFAIAVVYLIVRR